MAQIHSKVTAATLAGALVSLLLGELNRRGITLGPDEASALTVLVTAVAGFVMPTDEASAAADAPPPVVIAPLTQPPPPPAAVVFPPQQGLAVPPGQANVATPLQPPTATIVGATP